MFSCSSGQGRRLAPGTSSSRTGGVPAPVPWVLLSLCWFGPQHFGAHSPGWSQTQINGKGIPPSGQHHLLRADFLPSRGRILCRLRLTKLYRVVQKCVLCREHVLGVFHRQGRARDRDPRPPHVSVCIPLLLLQNLRSESALWPHRGK